MMKLHFVSFKNRVIFSPKICLIKCFFVMLSYRGKEFAMPKLECFLNVVLMLLVIQLT